MVFDILVAGSGNDVTVFLVALMTVFAALAGLMQVGRAWALALAQRGAMFAVAAPMLPAPDLWLPVWRRSASVLWWRPDCRAAQLPYGGNKKITDVSWRLFPSTNDLDAWVEASFSQ
jgi:hypothetical protein